MRSPFLLAALYVLSLQAFAQDVQKNLQRAMILAGPGEVIEIPAGHYAFDRSLSLEGKSQVSIRGAGMDQTFLSFKGQSEGAEGIRISNCDHIVLEGFTVQDARGDAIKAFDVEQISFRHLRAEWTGKPGPENGAYGLYPVNCRGVRIEQCEAIGASDAGIYVGQSHDIVVSGCRAYHNVAGIEIENSTLADVHGCEVWDNTGGILVFDLPDLPVKRGSNCRIFQNTVRHNNYPNFAPKGNIVAQVPPGSGVMILAAHDVEVFDNDIRDSRTFGVAVVSYHITEIPINDPEYDPYPSGIYIHNNRFEREKRSPSLRNKIGLLLWLKFGRRPPDILYDGITSPNATSPEGLLLPEFAICIRENGGARFAQLDAANKFKGLSTDLSPFDCRREALKSPEEWRRAKGEQQD